MLARTEPRTQTCPSHSLHAHISPPLDKDVASALMCRSIQFRHGRLAVVRLCIAVHCGATVEPEHWQYCRRVAACERDAKLQELLEEASHFEEELHVAHAH